MADLNQPPISRDDSSPVDHNYARGTSKIPDISGNSLDQNSFDVANGNDNNWQTVSKRRSFEPLSRSKKKSKQGSSPSCSIELRNSFETLSGNETSMDADGIKPKLSEPKPPPIFIPDVGNVQAMIQTFESVVTTDDFSYKCVNNNSVKILPKSADIYRILVRKLNDGNVSFHTYQLKQERAYRVVLKNMHYSVDTNELKTALGQLGHTVRNIKNVIQSSTKKPLSMFFIDLEPSPNNKQIFNVQYLLHAKIVFEPPHKKKEVVQCKRCQQYGHTKSYCRHPFKCVKCGKDHDTSACDKDASTPAVCALCGGDHPANYKGCSVYKSIQSLTNPRLRNRTENSHVTMARPNSPTFRPVQSNLSFAEATKNAGGVDNNAPAVVQRDQAPTNAQTASPTSGCPKENENGHLTQVITNFFEKFEKIMLQQAQQVGTLMNLLSTVISKLK